ncbi:hypothetical protein FGG08_002801 [Glutinoglossum americanum]|uniref:Uncharacterized protein n=1 Tax=Glutinoglossum americanum TaxID=1670608 RepID=A0A9P8I5M2_9PEZI|nr:hypothetical protein FGG08_002801 [Glutinoglossum americanum]
MDSNLVSHSKSALAPPPNISAPSTPSNQHASLPEISAITSRSRSLSFSTEQTSSSPTVTRDSPSYLQSSSRTERPRYMSPPPSSMTPPPSSQIPPRSLSSSSSPPRQTIPTIRGTSTPPTSLASPPATLQALRRDGRSTAVQNAASLTPQISDLPATSGSPTELQTLLRASSSKVAELTTLLHEARMSAAHYKLQHNLLTIETEEAAKRMEVEHEMTKREVEILRFRQHQPGDAQHSASGAYMPNIRQMNSELEQHCQNLEQHMELLRHRLRQAKKLIMLRDGEAQVLTEQNEMLRKRIRDNREHLNQLRRPGGLYDPNPPRQTETAPVTPQQSALKPTGTPRHGHMSSGQEGRQDTFAALLLADQVLSQETTSAPSTPTRSRPSKPRYHSRDHHSLSSLHSTPRQSQLASANNNSLLPPVSLSSTPKTPSKKHVEEPPQHKRRESRDSTISASEKGGDTSDEGDVVSESAAIRLATTILRRSPGQSIEVLATPSPRSTGLLQGKLFGRVVKPGVDRSSTTAKRKGAEGETEDDSERDPKRMKTNKAIGLGIGSWGSPTI